MEVGFCLHSINICLLSSWINFSKKWEQWENSKECEEQWEWFNRNNNKDYTIGSLHYWAKNDNPDEYKDIIRDSLSGLVHSSVGSSGSHADVANVIYHYFKDCHLFVPILRIIPGFTLMKKKVVNGRKLRWVMNLVQDFHMI